MPSTSIAMVQPIERTLQVLLLQALTNRISILAAVVHGVMSATFSAAYALPNDVCWPGPAGLLIDRLTDDAIWNLDSGMGGPAETAGLPLARGRPEAQRPKHFLIP